MNGRRGKMGDKLTRLAAPLALCFLLAACTAGHPPSYRGMPERDSIVAGEEITVGRDQNVYGIAHKHGVSMREIIVLNDLKPPFALRFGQKLLLPAKDGQAGYTAGGTMAPAPAAAPLGAIEAAPLDSGDTPPTSSSSVSAMPLEAPQALPKNDTAATKPPQANDKPVDLAPQKTITTTVTPQARDKVAEVAPAAKPAPKAESVPSTPPTSTPAEEETSLKEAPVFAWPVQGPIVSAYGPKEQGLNNDGINIGAPKNAPVSAAAGGIVVYAGNEMKGFGNLVLIRHEGGWVTAYAHLNRVMVARDSVVAAGDMIGTVGTTGGVASPQLHFETRRDGKPVNPQTVITKGK